MTASSTRRVEVVSPMRCVSPLRSRLSAHVVPGPGDAERDVLALARGRARWPSARDPVKSTSDIPMVSRTSTRVAGPASARARVDLLAEVDGVGVPERRGEEDDEDAGLLRGVGRRPRAASSWSCPGHAPEHVELGPGAQADPVEDGQPDGDGDALLHADEHHGEQRDRGQRELEEVEAGDGAQVAPA